MSMAIRAKNAKQRATIAVNMLKNNCSFSRAFDDCFEMGDGNDVMNHIIEKARHDVKLAIGVKEKMPLLGYGYFNIRLHEAIKECYQKNNVVTYSFS
ncbi:hypothetical protein [Paenibacillus pini]|uniref:Uncharacterized protein n=1 Tax=Paenibacillus pini JCM 16418 TaxID=1236976 RepID=W7Z8P6_9BACL|nr:hypothetical protein [Paenibacillus pini]GAF10814.1 hypothetical protein JCM16418_5037 [Paenibacillus pini JCM 16418]